VNRCPEKNYLVLYAADELPAAKREALEVHLARCDACRREAEALARGLAALGNLEREPAPRPEVVEEARRRMREAKRPAVLPFVRRWAAAAVAAALILAAILWTPWTTEDTTPVPYEDTQAEALDEIEVAIALLELADASTYAAPETVPAEAETLNGTLDEIELFIELDDEGLLLDYLMSREELRG
jgi:anti-sigma factor RsiW